MNGHKKIIAREGLIILAFIICALIVDFFIRVEMNSQWDPPYRYLADDYIDMYSTQSHWIFFILFMLCAVTRFTVWAIRTLKEEIRCFIKRVRNIL